MKKTSCILFLAWLASWPTPAQTAGPVTITGSDMFNQVGQYYRAYSNSYDISGSSTNTPPPYQVPSNLIGSAGPNQLWDFSTGPTNVIYRFDYLSITNPAVSDATAAADFPLATVVEHQTDEASGGTQDLYFSQDPVKGRTVYGFYTTLLGLDNPVSQFLQPMVDFPATISYQQTWQTSSSIQGTGVGLGLQIVFQSTFLVDAYGTIKVPKELGSFGPGLRVHELVTQSTYYDQNAFNGTSGGPPDYVLYETDNSINYYWLMPGRGIVASLASTAGSLGQAPPDNFSTATQFWRMFETNHKASTNTGGGCTAPSAVTDLNIEVNNGSALLSWSKVNCASQYRLEYSTNFLNPSSWKTLSTVTNQLLFLDSTTQDQARFYRVVSLK